MVNMVSRRGMPETIGPVRAPGVALMVMLCRLVNGLLLLLLLMASIIRCGVGPRLVIGPALLKSGLCRPCILKVGLVLLLQLLLLNLGLGAGLGLAGLGVKPVRNRCVRLLTLLRCLAVGAHLLTPCSYMCNRSSGAETR